MGDSSRKWRRVLIILDILRILQKIKNNALIPEVSRVKIKVSSKRLLVISVAQLEPICLALLRIELSGLAPTIALSAITRLFVVAKTVLAGLK